MGGDIVDPLAPFIGADGTAEFAEGVGLDGYLVFDGFVGMLGMVEIDGVLGGDDPVGRGDAAIGGADAEAPVALGAGEQGGAAAGEAFMEFIGIGHDFWAEFFPGFEDQAFDVGHGIPP